MATIKECIIEALTDYSQGHIYMEYNVHEDVTDNQGCTGDVIMACHSDKLVISVHDRFFNTQCDYALSLDDTFRQWHYGDLDLDKLINSILYYNSVPRDI